MREQPTASGRVKNRKRKKNIEQDQQTGPGHEGSKSREIKRREGKREERKRERGRKGRKGRYG